ncbi:helicase associated domain-containing protein (plasmid) [Kitasatospora griseola]|uniref:helicase associated domain-containing protein n=1 Tax=Kitasatospora griseola TaxID=2064 RepID=UPI003855A77F
MSNAVLQPRYWLAHALEWPQGESPYRECAQALAPPIIPRQMVSRDVADILAVADAYQNEHPTRRLVFFSDLTLWLDGHGSDWGQRGTDWEGGYAYAKAFHRRHGHLAIPATAKLDDYAVGAWMRRQRKAENLTADQVAKLDVLDELWRLEPDWNRSYRRLLAYLAVGGTLDGPANRTGLGDDPTFRPGTWLRKQDKARTEGKLTDQQTALLDALTRRAETVTG